MVEVDFERRLERLFAGAPELPDGDDFAVGVERRLDRSWNTRRWLVGAAGVAGGLIAASQILMSNLTQRVENAGESAKVLTAGLTQITPRAEWLTNMAGGGAVVWAASVLAIVAMGFALSRVIEEL